jgi:hypothetical protein
VVEYTGSRRSTLYRILEISEVEQVSCSPDVSRQTTEVEVSVAGDPLGITESDEDALENVFVQTYNELAENSCDELFRTVVNASKTWLMEGGILCVNDRVSSLRSPLSTGSYSYAEDAQLIVGSLRMMLEDVLVKGIV